ncbi:MAG TPA: carbohydrate kinase family protein [Bryobacteraceae bacterium]|nr:carbohydrate kinase family protein [Bryobacteraceae bacterium]
MKTDRRLDCLVAGDANADLLIDGIAQLEFEKEKLATDMKLVLGGSSSIFAFNFARLGAKVGFVGVVGDDFFGRFVEERLRWAGVDVRALRRERRIGTGLTIWCKKGTQRAGITYNGTIAMLRARDITERDLRRSRHLHVGSYFLLEKFHPAAPALFRRAQKLGLTTSLDCNYDPAETWDSGIRQVLKFTDIFFPNETEALRLTNARNAEHAARKLAGMARIAAVKLGARGAVVCSEGKLFRIPAVKARHVDTTGAGDSFDAGFLACFLKGGSLEASARAGAAAGARAVSAVGGTGAFE